ncbi:MAG: hypothetical protein KA354_02350 [Phycisphaerae bacterium]|nr:hypothetical protein [Phycisphaerae bacterium]
MARREVLKACAAVPASLVAAGMIRGPTAGEAVSSGVARKTRIAIIGVDAAASSSMRYCITSWL